MNARALLAILMAVAATACTDAEKERLIRTTVPTYDKATGKLTQLTYDANRDGRVDTWTSMDGTRPLVSRIDRNEDGRADRWEYYDGSGALTKVGFSRKDDDQVDAWAFPGPDGQVERIESSSTGSETRIDRREYYVPSRAGAGGQPTLARVEIDADDDGRIDRWETYEDGVLHTVAFDGNGDSQPDQRLTYARGTLVLIESDPDGAGGFSTRRHAKN
jgi:hypothetical protein